MQTQTFFFFSSSFLPEFAYFFFQRWQRLTEPVWGAHHLEYMVPDQDIKSLTSLSPVSDNKVIIFESVMWSQSSPAMTMWSSTPVSPFIFIFHPDWQELTLISPCIHLHYLLKPRIDIYITRSFICLWWIPPDNRGGAPAKMWIYRTKLSWLS